MESCPLTKLADGGLLYSAERHGSENTCKLKLIVLRFDIAKQNVDFGGSLDFLSTFELIKLSVHLVYLKVAITQWELRRKFVYHGL